MSADRFKQRRLNLAARHMCSHCGQEPAKPACQWCATCISTENAKREIKHADAQAFRRLVARQRSELLLLQLRQSIDHQ